MVFLEDFGGHVDDQAPGVQDQGDRTDLVGARKPIDSTWLPGWSASSNRRVARSRASSSTTLPATARLPVAFNSGLELELDGVEHDGVRRLAHVEVDLDGAGEARSLQVGLEPEAVRRRRDVRGEAYGHEIGRGSEWIVLRAVNRVRVPHPHPRTLDPVNPCSSSLELDVMGVPPTLLV